MNENLTFTEKVSLKWCNFKNAVGTKVHNACNWVADHPVETSAILGVTATTVSKAYKFAKLHEEKTHRDLDFYDPRNGRYTRAKRKPKNWELDEIEYRYNRGESYNEILRDMNLRK